VCNYGEAFSLKVYANLINSLSLEEVTIFDPHSEVTPALIENCRVVDNHQFISKVINDLPIDYCLVSPDAGSNKKIFSLARHLGGPEVIRADKIRSVGDGKIIGTEVFADDLSGKTLWIVDDIISGGRTFIELAKRLKEKGAAKILLVVSHDEGVCSERLLKDAGIDQMFTTNSIKSSLTSSDFRVVFDIKEFL
jgi:ribose-phosphate pyrophosphokinase